MTLPTDRTTANTAAEHVADHNTLHAEYNVPTHTHSGTYVANSDPKMLAASALRAATAGPTLNDIYGVSGHRIAAWMLDAAAEEGVNGLTRVPTGWATVNLIVRWVNGGAGAGDVVLRGDYKVLGAGDTIAIRTFATPVTVTAAALNVVTDTTLFSGVAVDPAKDFSLAVIRVAADAADTLANDIAVLGVRLVKAS